MKIKKVTIGLIVIIIVGGIIALMALPITTPEDFPPNEDTTRNDGSPDVPNDERTSPQENWVEFKDDVAGYRIFYPEEWHTSRMERYTEESTIESFVKGEIPIGTVPSSEIKIAVRRFIPDTRVQYSPPPAEQVLEERELTVAGQPATWRRIASLGTNISIEVRFKENTYLISAYPADSVYLDKFEEMVETFEFAPSVDMEEPTPNSTVTSPVEVRGQAPGTWFFEATLSAELTDTEDNILGRSTLETSENWMTEEQVPFAGLIELDETLQDGTRLTLIIRSANPSGLPELERTLIIPLEYGMN